MAPLTFNTPELIDGFREHFRAFSHSDSRAEGEKSPSRTLSSVLLWSNLLQLLMSPVSCSDDQVILTLEG